MPSDPLRAFTQSLLSYMPPDDVESSPKVIVVKPPVAAPTPIRPNGQKPQPTIPDYDPALVCVLELATVLAMRDQDSASLFGKDVAQCLKSVIHDADGLHPVTLGRASYYLLNLLKASEVSTVQCCGAHFLNTKNRTTIMFARQSCCIQFHLSTRTFFDDVAQRYSRESLNASKDLQVFEKKWQHLQTFGRCSTLFSQSQRLLRWLSTSSRTLRQDHLKQSPLITTSQPLVC